MTTQHDNSYKLLSSHPQMVKDLLIRFVKEAWVEQLDFSTLEKVSGSYVSDELRDREDDIIWRVRWGDDWLYVYLLLDEGAIVNQPEWSDSMRNLVAALFRLEHNRDEQHKQNKMPLFVLA
jgi:hypothetical protein